MKRDFSSEVYPISRFLAHQKNSSSTNLIMLLMICIAKIDLSESEKEKVSAELKILRTPGASISLYILTVNTLSKMIDYKSEAHAQEINLLQEQVAEQSLLAQHAESKFEGYRQQYARVLFSGQQPDAQLTQHYTLTKGSYDALRTTTIQLKARLFSYETEKKSIEEAKNIVDTLRSNLARV